MLEALPSHPSWFQYTSVRCVCADGGLSIGPVTLMAWWRVASAIGALRMHTNQQIGLYAAGTTGRLTAANCWCLQQLCAVLLCRVTEGRDAANTPGCAGGVL
jgi:hypothetical protein